MSTDSDSTNRTYPGFHKNFNKERFNSEEIQILNKLAGEWYLTNSGETINLGGANYLGKNVRGTSEYNFFLMSPINTYTEMFNLRKELIVVFSPYETFESRTLDAFNSAQLNFGDLRIEKVCRVNFKRPKC